MLRLHMCCLLAKLLLEIVGSVVSTFTFAVLPTPFSVIFALFDAPSSTVVVFKVIVPTDIPSVSVSPATTVYLYVMLVPVLLWYAAVLPDAPTVNPSVESVPVTVTVFTKVNCEI